MTNKQLNNLYGFVRFCENINKLSVGRSTQYTETTSTGYTTHKYGKITCTTVGRKPRLFTVSGSQIIPNGTGYTYKTIMKHLLDDTMPVYDEDSARWRVPTGK